MPALARAAAVRPRTLPIAARLPLLAIGVACLLGGLWGALGRVGFAFPPIQPDAVAFHGALLVSGFLGTLICLERAVALGRWWGLSAPLASGLGGLSLLWAPGAPGVLAMTLAGVALVAVLLALFRVQPSWAGAVGVLGAAAWASGSALFGLGFELPRAVDFWAAFLVLTIAGERLELARFLAPSRLDRASFAVACAATAVGPVLALVAPDAGSRVAGSGLGALAVWLGLRDMARRGVRRAGLTRFSAVCLLSGYVWLGVAGGLELVGGAGLASPAYDAWLHALFVGFVMAMIFGHAPIVFPTLLGREVPFRSVFYVHVVLLHATLALRVAGDLLGLPPAVRWGGLGNALAILVFFANTALSVARGSARRGAWPGAPPHSRPPAG